MYILPKIGFRTSIYKPVLADVIGSHRYLHEPAGNWKVYLDVLEAMMPVLCVTHRYRYSKWLTVHIHEMKVVVVTAPKVYDGVNGREICCSENKASILYCQYRHAIGGLKTDM